MNDKPLGQCPECDAVVDTMCSQRSVTKPVKSTGDQSHIKITVPQVQSQPMEYELHPCGHWVSYRECMLIMGGETPERRITFTEFEAALKQGVISRKTIAEFLSIDIDTETKAMYEEIKNYPTFMDLKQDIRKTIVKRRIRAKASAAAEKAKHQKILAEQERVREDQFRANELENLSKRKPRRIRKPGSDDVKD